MPKKTQQEIAAETVTEEAAPVGATPEVFDRMERLCRDLIGTPSAHNFHDRARELLAELTAKGE